MVSKAGFLGDMEAKHSLGNLYLSVIAVTSLIGQNKGKVEQVHFHYINKAKNCLRNLLYIFGPGRPGHDL